MEKKLSGCASNLLAHEDLGNFEEAHCWNMQAKLYNENSHIAICMNDNLYGVQGKRWSTSVDLSKGIVVCPLLSFYFFFSYFYFFIFFLASVALSI